jgi:8-oxo-dGTP pyrophosphatase MutT (NUDIX family)
MQITVDTIRSGLSMRSGSERHDPHLLEGPPVAAAVLIPIINRPTGLTVLLTQRTAHLRDHAGQVSFPGGRCEAYDLSPVAAALRECAEEVGIPAWQVEVVGVLPDYFTGTGFRVTPVVGIVTPPLNLKLDDFEVAEVFEPPLVFLLDPANYRREEIDYRGARRSYWAVPWRDYFIWGATAGMLMDLRNCLLSSDAFVIGQAGRVQGV